MSADTQPVSVRILDREYTIGVDDEGRDALMAAAKLLDAKMREIRSASRMASVDRVAVLAALNLAHELQQLRERDTGIERLLSTLERKLDGAGID